MPHWVELCVSSLLWYPLLRFSYRFQWKNEQLDDEYHKYMLDTPVKLLNYAIKIQIIKKRKLYVIRDFR